MPFLSLTQEDWGVFGTRHGGRELRHGPSLSTTRRDDTLADAGHKLRH